MATTNERQRTAQLYRGQIPSPGRPTAAWRQDRVHFWAAIARGAKTVDAAAEAGVSSPVAFRWFRHDGGVNPYLPPTVSGRYLSCTEREIIAIWHAQKLGVREIARQLNRSPSTILRELRRNASPRTFGLEYRASLAQWHAERRARRPQVAKLAGHERLRAWLQDRLAAEVQLPDGTVVGPKPKAWNARTSRIGATARGFGRGGPEQSLTARSATCPVSGH